MYDSINETEIRLLLNYIFDTMSTTKLPFIAANYVSNIIAIAQRKNVSLSEELVRTYPVEKLINMAFTCNIMGSGSLARILSHLNQHNKQLHINARIPQVTSTVSGIRERFIDRNGLNPAIFNTWL